MMVMFDLGDCCVVVGSASGGVVELLVCSDDEDEDDVEGVIMATLLSASVPPLVSATTSGSLNLLRNSMEREEWRLVGGCLCMVPVFTCQ